MSGMASQITSLTIVYSTVDPGADQRKHQSPASLAFVRGIHRGPVNSPHKWPVTRKLFPFDDVIMIKCVVTNFIAPVMANGVPRTLVLRAKCRGWNYHPQISLVRFHAITDRFVGYSHDDVIKWKHLLALCSGNSPVISEFPPQSPVTRSFGVFFDLRLSKQSRRRWFEAPSRSLWRHCNVEGEMIIHKYHQSGSM